MSDRQKLNKVPDPPIPCSEMEDELFREKAEVLLEEGNLYSDMLQGLADLCSNQVQLQNIRERNKRILEVLELESVPAAEPPPLFTNEDFDRRFMELLGEGEEQKRAYQLTESEHRSYYHKTKYKNFQSYYRSWRRRQKQKLNGESENCSGAVS